MNPTVERILPNSIRTFHQQPHIYRTNCQQTNKQQELIRHNSVKFVSVREKNAPLLILLLCGCKKDELRRIFVVFVERELCRVHKHLLEILSAHSKNLWQLFNNGTLCVSVSRETKICLFLNRGYKNTHICIRKNKKPPKQRIQLYISFVFTKYWVTKNATVRWDEIFIREIRNWFLIVCQVNRNNVEKLMTQQWWQQPANICMRCVVVVVG